MFSSEKKKAYNSNDNGSIERNRISKKTIFKGSVESEGDFRIDGVVEGDIITTGKVIIGVSGSVIGTVKCINADIEGAFKGHLEVKSELWLKPTANVHGDVYMESLTVEPGAVFNANCKMISLVKELNPIRIEDSKEEKHLISKIS